MFQQAMFDSRRDPEDNTCMIFHLGEAHPSLPVKSSSEPPRWGKPAKRIAKPPRSVSDNFQFQDFPIWIILNMIGKSLINIGDSYLIGICSYFWRPFWSVIPDCHVWLSKSTLSRTISCPAKMEKHRVWLIYVHDLVIDINLIYKTIYIN